MNAQTRRRMLTAGEIAELLNCGTRTVWRWADSDILPPAVRIGRLVRWDAATIERWIEDGCPRTPRQKGRVH